MMDNNITKMDNNITMMDNKIIVMDNNLTIMGSNITILDNVTVIDHNITILDNVTVIDHNITILDNVAIMDHNITILDNVTVMDHNITILDNVTVMDHNIPILDNVTVMDHNITTLNSNFTYSGLYSLGSTREANNSIETHHFDWTNLFPDRIETSTEQKANLTDFVKSYIRDRDLADIALKTTTFPQFVDANKVAMLPNTTNMSSWNLSFLDLDGQVSLNSTTDDYLSALNRDFANRVLPAVLVLVVLMVIGAVGNMVVLFVYSCKTKRGTVTRFIQALAVFDLLSCCVAIPGEIIDMTNNYTFGSNHFCKVVRTVNLFCTLASGATLVVVSIDRYKRICCPLRRQISPKGAVIIICCCAISSMLVSLPTVTFYGSRTITTGVPFVNGTDCSISDGFANTMFPLAYNSLQMFLFLVGAVTLIILYILIGSKVCRHVHRQVTRHRKSVSLGHSRFSHGNQSDCSSYFANTDNACHLEAHSSAKGDDPTKHATTCKTTDAKQDTIINTTPVLIAKIQVNCGRHNTGKKDYKDATDLTGEVGNLLINHKQDLQKGAAQTKDDSNIMATSHCCASSKEAVCKYSGLADSVCSNRSQAGTIMNVLKTNNSIECLQPAEMSHYCQPVHKTDFPADDTNVEPGVLKQLSLNHKSHNLCHENIPLIGSMSENNFNCSNVASSLGTLDSDQNVESVTKCNLAYSSSNYSPRTDSTSSSHSTSSNNSFTSSPPTTPLEIVDNPTRALLTTFGEQTRKGNSNSSSISPYNRRDIRKAITDDLNSERRNKQQTSSSNCFASKESYFDLGHDKINSLKINIANSQSSKPFLEAIESEGERKYCKAPSILLMRRNTITESDSFRMRARISLGYFSHVPKVQRQVLLNKSLAGITNQLGEDDRGNTKGKVYTNGTRRTTLMLFVITIVYVFSFLPHLVLMAIKALDEASMKGYGTSWELAQNLLIRSYFINSMANPIIYSFFTKNFFRECQKSFSCCKKLPGNSI